MSLTQRKSHIISSDTAHSPARRMPIFSWLSCWEVYPLVLVTSLLCFYRLNTTEFNGDQADIYTMAHNAVAHGLIPVTSNPASIGLYNPPGVIYVLMIPALFSPDPLWAAVQQALFTICAVLLTYIFARRYYGRLTGFFAAALYGTATSTIHYGRFIWQQNMMAPFLVLFMFALFWGVVERRKGWMPFALLLLGFLFQLHESSTFLAVPLFVAVILAFKTLRWRDIGWSALFLGILYLPYAIWEYHVKFADVQAFYALTKLHSYVDDQVFTLYQLMLSPYGQQPTNAHSVILQFIPVLSWLLYAMPLLVICGAVTALVLILRPDSSSDEAIAKRPASPVESLKSWWKSFYASPYRCGLAVLLAWQAPLLYLARHAYPLQLHYVLFLMPGPYILIALFFTKLGTWFRQHQFSAQVIQYVGYVLVAVIVIGQLIGSTASVIDISSGNFDDRTFYKHYRNDLYSLQHALSEADQLAQQQHLKHVYVTTDDSTAPALRYLSQQMQTPTSLFDATNCLLLPGATTGPAVLLVGPYDSLTNALLSTYTSARLVEQPARPGGAPFKLYVVTPPTAQQKVAGTFEQNLQLLASDTRRFDFSSSLWMVSHWNMLRTAQVAMRTVYHYNFTAQSGSSGGTASQSDCTFTSMQAGDQLFVAFELSAASSTPPSVTVEAQSFTTTQYNPSLGPLHFESFMTLDSTHTALQTPEGAERITILTKQGT